MAARSLLFQLARFVSSRLLGALHRRASPSTGRQRVLAAATSHKVAEAGAHGEGVSIVSTTLPRDREADVGAELLVGKRRAPSPKPRRPGKPRENQPGRDKHNGVPDKEAKEGKQGIRNNYAAAS